MKRLSVIFVGLTMALCGCATHQVLPESSICGRVLDHGSGLPLPGASVRFVYRGPTKDMPASRGTSQSMEDIEAGIVTTDATGAFCAQIPVRKVPRPLAAPWDPHPDIS